MIDSDVYVMAHSCDVSLFDGSLPTPTTMRRRCRHSGLELGGPISEERFLQLQSEVYRLKKEATERGERHKVLLGRLSRAEDAAKRNMRDCFQQSLEPCKMKTNIIAAVNHTFYADQRMLELEDKLREKHRELEKITEFNKQYKADIISLRARMERMLRSSRRSTPFITPRDISSAGSIHDKGARDLRKEVQKLITENLNLQFQISSLFQPQAPSKTQSMQDNGTQAEEGECVLKQSIQSAHEASAKYVSAQMLETWQQLEALQDRYDKSLADLQTLKQNHEKLLEKLRDELNEERGKSISLEISETRLTQELAAVQHTQLLLQQARQHNHQLERENADLIAAALRTTHVKTKPSNNLVEDRVIVLASHPQESQA